MPGIAGKRALVKITGAAVAMVDQVCTSLGDNQNYRITDAAKRILDPTAAITVKVNGGAVAASTYSVNRLNGVITFTTVLVRTTVAISTSYLTATAVGGAKSYSWNLALSLVDDTDYDSANTDSGFTRWLAGLWNVNGSIGNRWRAETALFTAVQNATPVVLEFYPDRTSNPELIVRALLNKNDLSAVHDGAIDGSVEFVGFADVDGRVASTY